MTLSKEVLNFFGLTKEDYTKWCEKNNRKEYEIQSRRDFYQDILDGKVC